LEIWKKTEQSEKKNSARERKERKIEKRTVTLFSLISPNCKRQYKNKKEK
jgi:hypothetical protein